jgi:hypothetical protein
MQFFPSSKWTEEEKNVVNIVYLLYREAYQCNC